MSTMRPAEFLDVLRAVATDAAPGSAWALATIDPGYVGGMPRLQWDGETTVSERSYPRLMDYTPVAGDRVLVALVGDGAVVLGAVG